jgi:hypothetical protein
MVYKETLTLSDFYETLKIIPKMKITLNLISFTLLVQKLQNDKYAQCTLPH